MKQLPFLNHAADRSSSAEVVAASSEPATSPVRDSSAESATAPHIAGATSTPAAINPRRPAIIVPVQATEAQELAAQCVAIAATGAVDVIEWRIDPIIARVGAQAAPATDAAGLAEAVLTSASTVSSAGLPVLVTLRTGFEGGTADVSETVYADILRRILEGMAGSLSAGDTGEGQQSSPPIALDVEVDRQAAQELIAAAHEHGICVVGSHHNFSSTDSAASLFAKFGDMSARGVDVAKLAMMPRSVEDVLELLHATAEADAALDVPVLGISMGELGRTSRVMGADFGSCASFAQLGEASAPGQIDVTELAGIFDRLYV